MPIVKTKGAASSQGFGEFAQASTVANYIEDVFSTYLYTGTGASQTITNGIDLSTKGGLVWTKTRSGGAGYDWHVLVDSARGVTKVIETNLTDAEATQTDLTSFTTTGYNLAAGSYYGNFNFSGAKFVSWTFRKQAKFFDVVTGTQSVAGNVTFNHNLGSVPGCILLKSTSNVTGGGEWYVYHRSLGTSQYLNLNTTDAASSAFAAWGGVAPTSTQFTMGFVYPVGTTVVAYLFAHNAGGFGLTGTDNVISCGSFTTDGSANATVDLGFEPQLVIYKTSSTTGNWQMQDNMRGFTAKPTSYSSNPILRANLSNSESTAGVDTLQLNATGFTTDAPSCYSNQTYIYIAIRRGPMKVPTSGTSVYQGVTRTGTGSAATITGTSFPPDLFLARSRVAGGFATAIDRLRGNTKSLETDATSAEFTSTSTQDCTSFNMNGVSVGTSQNTSFNNSGEAAINWFFGRAPSFFDVVCYTGNATSGATQTHNLGVVPEMMIVKNRSAAGYDWFVYHKNLTSAAYYLNLNSTAAESQYWNAWNSTQPTSSVFTIGNYSAVNASGNTYVAYLFATCAGVSKVGSYTGNGSTQTINCGFTGGARFVLIKRTDSTGDWYVYDTARGMTTLTDPYLLLNSTAAETATLGSVTTVSTGFALNASILAAINTNGASYIFLAIS